MRSAAVREWSVRLVAVVAVASIGHVAVAAGRRAPAVALPLADGTVKRLADLRGSVVLVDFWASWCGPCKESFPALDGLYRELHARGLEVVAINVDERRRDAEAFLAGRSPAMTVLFDPKGVAPRLFNVRAMPSSALIDRAGNIRFTHEGYSAKTLESYRREIATLLTEPSPKPIG